MGYLISSDNQLLSILPELMTTLTVKQLNVPEEWHDCHILSGEHLFFKILSYRLETPLPIEVYQTSNLSVRRGKNKFVLPDRRSRSLEVFFPFFVDSFALSCNL